MRKSLGKGIQELSCDKPNIENIVKYINHLKQLESYNIKKFIKHFIFLLNSIFKIIVIKIKTPLLNNLMKNYLKWIIILKKKDTIKDIIY